MYVKNSLNFHVCNGLTIMNEKIFVDYQFLPNIRSTDLALTLFYYDLDSLFHAERDLQEVFANKNWIKTKISKNLK